MQPKNGCRGYKQCFFLLFPISSLNEAKEQQSQKERESEKESEHKRRRGQSRWRGSQQKEIKKVAEKERESERGRVMETGFRLAELSTLSSYIDGAGAPLESGGAVEEEAA